MGNIVEVLLENITVGDFVTSASGNTSGVAVDVQPLTTKSGEQIVRVLVETSDNEMKWITLKQSTSKMGRNFRPARGKNFITFTMACQVLRNWRVGRVVSIFVGGSWYNFGIKKRGSNVRLLFNVL